jgi:hypothetical protein
MAFVNKNEHWSPLKCGNLTLYGERPPNSKGAPSCSLIITYGGNTKFVVYLNNGTDSKPLEFTLGSSGRGRSQNLHAIINALEAAIKDRSHTGLVKSYQCKEWFGRDKVRYEKPKTAGVISVVRDDKGRICLTFQVRNDEPVMFPFRCNEDFVMLEANGERTSTIDESEEMAMAWVEQTRGLINSFLAVMLKQPEPKEEKPNKYSGGGNRGGYNNGGNNNSKPAAMANSGGGNFGDYDDDVNM